MTLSEFKSVEEVKKLIEASQRIMFLHMCEQEGITCGMPSPQDWYAAVDFLGQALLPFSEASIDETKEQKQDTSLNKSYTEINEDVSELIKRANKYKVIEPERQTTQTVLEMMGLIDDFAKNLQHLQAEVKRKDEALNISKLMLKDIDNKLKADQYLIDDRDDQAVRTIIKQELKRIEQALAEQQSKEG